MLRRLRPLRLLAVAVVLLSVMAGVLAAGWLLDDRALDAGASVTEGVITEVRERPGRDEVVVSLDQLDGRPVSVSADGPAAVGDRLAVEYDPDGGADVGRVAGSDRDLRDGRSLLAVALVVGVLTAALAPWRRRTDRDPPRPATG